MGFIKIASMDVNNYPFLEYIAKKKKPIVLSTGMANLEEITKAIETIKNTGNNQIILLHCISIYPLKAEDVHLNNLDLLREKFNLPVGFSDHSQGVFIPVAAAAKGACIIEKHFTLDKETEGWDHSMSIIPKELKLIVEGCNDAYKSLGKKQRIITQQDLDKQKHFRRSLTVNKPLKTGHILTKEDIDFKRPGISFEPDKLNFVVGKIIKRDMDYDEIIFPEDIE